MSLLIFSSANRIALGVLKRLYNSNNFEKIVCADLFPNYTSIQRLLNYKHQLEQNPSNTKITDIKISEKSDLAEAIKSASHVLYITHDYYTLVPSKLNLIKTVAELSKKNKSLQKLVALTPVEHDHYGENNSVLAARKSENEARNIYPDLIHLKSDITFGEDSTIANSIISRIVNGVNITFQPRAFDETAAPIHTDDVAEVVEAVLRDDSAKGKAYALQGNEKVTLGELISILQKHTGKAVQLNELALERLIPPYQANLITERLYEPDYINLARFLRQYRTMEKTGLESISKFKPNLKDLNSAYSAKVNESLYKPVEAEKIDNLIKKFLY